MVEKNILSLLILLSVFMVMVLPGSFGICIPGGCDVDNNACIDGVCVDESISQYISERMLLTGFILKSQQTILFLIIVLSLLSLFNNYLIKIIETFNNKLCAIYKIFNFQNTRLFDYLIRVYSDGILNPKIF